MLFDKKGIPEVKCLEAPRLSSLLAYDGHLRMDAHSALCVARANKTLVSSVNIHKTSDLVDLF